MADISFLLTQATIDWNTGMWGALIGWFNSFIPNYGWTIIVFTILIKIIVSPLDFLQRRAGVKSAEAQAKLKPDLDKIQKKYANDPEKARMKMQERQVQALRNGEMKIGSTCGVSLLYLVLMSIIFISLFSSMQTISKIQTINSYIQFENTYDEAVSQGKTKEEAEQIVLDMYNRGEARETWLWIDNIWKSDTATSVVYNFNEFKEVASAVSESPYIFEETEGSDKVLLTQAKYDEVMGKITTDTADKWNGYYILIILCGLISFFSFQISMGASQKRLESQNTKQPLIVKIMKFAMPCLMVIITLKYSSAFALYIASASLFTLAATPIYNKIISKTSKSNIGTGNNNKETINVDYKINKITKLDN